MSSLVIESGRLFDPSQQLDQVADLYIQDGRILAHGTAPDGFQPQQRIDAKGLLVCPGLIDLQARLREPGQEHKATIASETRAALAGGITTIICPPDTEPVIDEPSTVELIHRRASDAGYAKVLPLAALTLGLKGQMLSEMATLKAAGCVGLSNADQPITDTHVLRRAFEYAATHDLPVFLQAQDSHLARNGCAHEGQVATRLGLRGIPEAAETVALAQLLELVSITGVRAHFSRISSQRGLQMIAAAKARGMSISADTSINHLLLCEHDINGYNANCHVLPPLRSEADRAALCAALKDGTLDAVCSDHQPHEPDAKLAPFPATAPGISSIEFLLPLLHKLVVDDTLDLHTAIAAVTCKPAQILQLNNGSLRTGTRADICLLNTDLCYDINTDTMLSAGKNSPLSGWQLHSAVQSMLIDGKLLSLTS